MKNVLIIGAGGIGKRHIRGFLRAGRARLSVCEPDDAKRAEVLGQYDIAEGFASLDTVPLDRFHLAVVAAPAHVHVPIAQRLIEAGLPFLTEKPLSVTMEGVDAMVRAVEKKNLVARVGYVRRCRPWMQRLKADLDAGRIGDVRMAYLNASQEFPKYRPDYQKTYYAKRAMGGGALLDCASHFIDVLLWTMGPVVEVGAMYDRLVLQGVECEDALLLNARFASGAMANVTVNQFQKPNESLFEFIGTKANLRVADAQGLLEYADDDSGKWTRETFVPEGMTFMEIHESIFARQAADFMGAVDGKPDVLCTLAEARDNLRVCLAARESYETKRIITLSEKATPG